jgi:hypothetical protein
MASPDCRDEKRRHDGIRPEKPSRQTSWKEQAAELQCYGYTIWDESTIVEKSKDEMETFAWTDSMNL